MPITRKKTILTLAAVAVLVSGAAPFVGRWLGDTIAGDIKARLSMLWPDFMELPEQDRALLASLSLECRLLKQPIGRAATIVCLRSATSAKRMKSVDPDPAARLDKLLGKARPVNSNGESV